MINFVTISSTLLLGYLCGSLSSAVIVCKLKKLPDPRSTGSLNPGATNVLRIGGRKAAALTLLGDLCKGLIPLLLVKIFFHSTTNENHPIDDNALTILLGITGIGAVLGHMYPLFFRFQGGKGVATALGVLHVLNPLLGLIFDLIWVTTAYFTRYSSLAAIVGWGIIPLVAYKLSPPMMPSVGIIAIFILYRHKRNLIRLVNGEEPKFGQSSHHSTTSSSG